MVTSCIDLWWDHFKSSLVSKTHSWPQKQQFGYVGFQETFDIPPVKPTKTESSFRKLDSPPTKLGMLFLTHLQARELCPQTIVIAIGAMLYVFVFLLAQKLAASTRSKSRFKVPPATWKCHRPLQRAAHHIKVIRPPCWFMQVATMRNC